MKKFQNKSKVFRHSSDIVADAPQGLPCKHITSYSTAFQVIFVISPPGRPAEMVDRRIWRMKAIVQQLVFCSIFSLYTIAASIKKTALTANHTPA